MQSGYFICQFHDQGIGIFFFSVQCRHSRDRIFALFDGISCITPVCGIASVRVDHAHTVDPVIADAVGGVFLWSGIERIVSLISCLVRVSGKSPILIV